jgi:hypothetical protein
MRRRGDTGKGRGKLPAKDRIANHIDVMQTYTVTRMVPSPCPRVSPSPRLLNSAVLSLGRPLQT